MAPPLAKRFKRSVRFLLLRGLLFFVRLLPLGVAQRTGDAFGLLAFRLAPKERAKALLSLQRAFPEAFDGLVQVPEEVRRMLLRAHAKGKGVVAVTGHVGHWELLGWSFVRQGIPLHVIAQKNVDKRLTQLAVDFRAHGNVHTVLRGVPGAAVGMLRALRRGDALGLLIDQDTRVQSLCVPFFGVQAATPRAPADLTLRTGAATVAVFLQRGEDGRYHFTGEELEVPHTLDAEADALELTRRYSAAIEAAIRRAPEQWVWMHQRWKTVC